MSRFLLFLLSLLCPLSASALPIPDLREVHVAFSPGGEALPRILRELRQARQSVDVAMFYLSHKDLTDALCFLAQQRGVTVRVVTDATMNKPAHQPVLDRLTWHGASIHVLPSSSKGLMHLKCAVIDGNTVIAGTANWSPTAFDQNFEDTLIIHSKTVSRIYLDQLESLILQADASHSQIGRASCRERV